MSILEKFLNAIQYRITDAWEHQWTSYQQAQVLGCVNEFAAFNVAFRRSDQTVIEITATSEMEADENVAYRWINPDFRDEIFKEADTRRIDRTQAFEGCQYIDLEVVDDILEKGVAMLANEKFDPRVIVPLDLDDDQLLVLFKMAHERDITFNQFLAEILLNAVEESKSDQ
jgi:hypothetical protein